MDESLLKRYCHVCGKEITCDCVISDYGLAKLDGLDKTYVEFDACPDCLGKIVSVINRTLIFSEAGKEK